VDYKRVKITQLSDNRAFYLNLNFKLVNKKIKTFLFIPDISGFMEFVNETEVEHSQHIISERLLEG